MAAFSESDHDKLVRLEERYNDAVRRLADLETNGGHIARDLLIRTTSIDKRLTDSETIVKRTAWIIISWTIGLILSATTFFIKLSGGNLLVPPH